MKLSIAAAIALLTMSTTVNGKDLCFASTTVDLVVKFFLTFYIKIPQLDYTPINRKR